MCAVTFNNYHLLFLVMSQVLESQELLHKTCVVVRCASLLSATDCGRCAEQ